MSCKTINIDLTNVPPVPIQIGVAGENSFRTITFDASKWGADYPDATYTVVYRRSDGYLYPVLVNASADAIVWNPTGTDTAVSGNGQLEVRLLDGETIGKTIITQTYVAPSLSGDESEPSTPAPDWVNDVADDADRAEEAASHYPKIVNGVLYVWDSEQEDWVQFQGGGGNPNAVLYTPQTLTPAQQAQARENIGAGTYTKPSGGIPASDLASDVQTSLEKADTALQSAPVTSVNTKTGAVTLTASDVGAYVKPSGGIPASDLASGVIPVVPQMATQADMSDWTSGKTVDAATMKTVVTSAGLKVSALEDDVDALESAGYQTASDVQTALSGVRQLPAVTASDNGKFLRVVSGAWAAETVQTWQGGSY